jgi:hypothetical protein
MAKIEYDGHIFDSEDEKKFYIWLVEAKAYGLIEHFTVHPEEIELIPKKQYAKRVLNKRTKTVGMKKGHLLASLSYQPDFEFTINARMINIYADYFMYLGSSCKNLLVNGNIENIDSSIYHIKIIVDIKSAFGNKSGMNSSAVTFPIKQKILFELQGIFVNKIIVSKWFENTWCPLKLKYMKNRKVPTLTKLGTGSRSIQEVLYE